MNPDALVEWLPPGEMTGQMHRFDGQVGGGYQMSLFYPETEPEGRGKTNGREDSVNVRFTALEPGKRIVQVVTFDSPDPAFAGEMTMTITFQNAEGGTEVRILCENIPPGIRPKDNEEGSRQSLENLARYVKLRT